jgi:Glycosyltransferase family 87
MAAFRRYAAPAVTPLTRAIANVVLVALPTLLLVVMLSDVVLGWKATPRMPVDFHVFWIAGHYYVHGQSPYRPSFAHTFVYPAPIAAFFAPFALLPYHAAALVFLAISTLAVTGSLWLLGVRDWRCYAATFLSPAALTAITVGTLTPLLLLGLAAAWKLRRRRSVAVPVALLIIGKLIFWPILIWLLLSGRKRAVAEALALALAVALVCWAPIGFAGMTGYPRLLDRLGAGYGPRSYAIVGLIGGGRAADVAVATVAIVVLWVARRSGEKRLFSLAVLATLACSPIVWLHYFAFLTAVVAILEPRFSVLWLVPPMLWVTPPQMIDGQQWRLDYAAAVCALVALLSLSRRGQQLGRDDLPFVASG